MGEHHHHLVTKANMLIEANYKLGTIEQKIILYLASQIQPNDSEFKNYTFVIKDFCKTIGLAAPKYKELQDITLELMKKAFTIRIDNEVTQISWLSSVTYKEQEGMMYLRFDPFLKPYLLQLKRNFTSYRLENVVKLKSSYSIRIYELLKQYEKIKERKFTLKELRLLLGAENIYPSYGNFKQRVLVTAQKELEEKTDLSFDILELKEGRRVASVIFHIKSKKPSQLVERFPLFSDNDLDPFTTKLLLFASEKGIKLDAKTIEDWRCMGEENVLNVIDSIWNRSDIAHPMSYIKTILEAKHQDLPEKETLEHSPFSIAVMQLHEEYTSRKEPPVRWLLEEKLLSKLIQAGVSEEDAMKFWKENGERIVDDIRNKAKMNRFKINQR